MMPSERSMNHTVPSDVSDEDDEDDQPRINHFHHSHSSENNRKGSDLESSEVFLDGYKGPIHKWEHPGIQFLMESAKVTSSTVERMFKIIIVGDSTVGKTSFVQRYVNDTYRQGYRGTIGVDFALKSLWKSEKEVIKIQLWDIAGQERFTNMTRVFYRDAQGCIVMFDLAKRSSFMNAMKWKRDVDAKCQLRDGSLLPAILLGNKCDLPFRDITQDEIEYAYKRGNYIGWTEVSAKDGLMVDDCMKFLVDAMLGIDAGKISVIEAEEVEQIQDKIDITKISNKKKSCCNS